MAYTDAGPKNGKPIVFVHGLTDNLYMWSLVTEEITALDPTFRLVSIDLRGHGESSMPSGKDCPNAPETCFTAKLYAEDLHDFLGKMGIQDAFVVGQSMGSIVAQQIALDYPQDVAGIVLVATSGNVGGNPVLKWLTDEILLGSWKPALAKKGMDAPQALWSALPTDADPQALQWMKDNWVGDRFAPPDFIDKMSDLTSKVRVGTFLGATRGLDQYDNLTRLETLEVPAFLMWGVQDAIFEFDRDQVPIIAALTRAASEGHTKVVWKQYGAAPAPAGGQTDVGHSVAWELPNRRPWTSFHTSGPGNQRRICIASSKQKAENSRSLRKWAKRLSSGSTKLCRAVPPPRKAAAAFHSPSLRKILLLRTADKNLPP